MKTLDIRLQMLMCGCALFLGTATVAWAEAVPQPRSGDGLAFGVVTGIVGTPVKLVTAIPAASRSLRSVMSWPPGMSCGSEQAKN